MSKILSQEEANDFVKKSGFLLLLEAPAQLELGFDNQSWKIGDKFRGIKLIPYGGHLVFYAQKEEGYQFKSGFLIYLSA
jgi:A1 cistron-splicing factor AAR2